MSGDLSLVRDFVLFEGIANIRKGLLACLCNLLVLLDVLPGIRQVDFRNLQCRPIQLHIVQKIETGRRRKQPTEVRQPLLAVVAPGTNSRLCSLKPQGKIQKHLSYAHRLPASPHYLGAASSNRLPSPEDAFVSPQQLKGSHDYASILRTIQ